MLFWPTSSEDDVVNLQDAERELAAAPVAPAFLLAEQHVLVLAVGHRRIDVGAPGDIGADRHQPVVEQVAHGLLQAHVDQLNGLGRDVDTDPAPAQVLGGDAGGSAAAEGGRPAKRGWPRKLSTTSPQRKRPAGIDPGEPPSPDLVFTLADPRAGPEGWVCLARGSAVWVARIL